MPCYNFTQSLCEAISMSRKRNVQRREVKEWEREKANPPQTEENAKESQLKLNSWLAKRHSQPSFVVLLQLQSNRLC